MKYVEIELPDDFEVGDCYYDCPFKYDEWTWNEDDESDCFTRCCLGYDDECKLNIKEK